MNQNRRLLCRGLSRLILFFCCFFICFSCGRKAPPLPPNSFEPPVVQNIEAKYDGDKLKLTWPKPEGKAEEEVGGFYVYRSKEKPGSICKECPVRFDKIAQIAHDPVSAVFEKRITYTETLEKGYHYKFRVTSYSIYGDEGAPSEVMDIDY